jgi:hypothetical protein
MMKQMVLMVLFLTAALGVFGQQGIIDTVSGTVELKPVGAAVFAPAKRGDRVARDTIVSTGFKSSANIIVGSTMLNIKPLTRLSLEEISEAEGLELLIVNLRTGRVRAEVKPAQNAINMTIRSHIATASVRGTTFEFDEYTLTVIEGTVAYSGANGGTVLVSAGGTSRIDPLTNRAADPIETAAAALRPNSPAGAGSPAAGSGGRINGGPGGNNDSDSDKVDIDIELKF